MMTCDGFTSNIAYNQEEADSIAKIPSLETISVEDTIAGKDLLNSIATDSVLLYKPDSMPKQKVDDSSIKHNDSNNTQTEKSWTQRLQQKMFFPTGTAASGLGTVMVFKNVMGKTAMAICIFLSLILLILYRWLKKPKTKMILLLMGIVSLLLFITDCFIADVTVLFGVWILLALQLLQYWMEWKEAKINKSISY